MSPLPHFLIPVHTLSTPLLFWTPSGLPPHTHTHTHTHNPLTPHPPGTRDSQAVVLLGDDGWVEHREGGVVFRLDITKCMYSSGDMSDDVSAVPEEGRSPPPARG